MCSLFAAPSVPVPPLLPEQQHPVIFTPQALFFSGISITRGVSKLTCLWVKENVALSKLTLEAVVFWAVLGKGTILGTWLACGAVQPLT